jgi:hypothetical protein
LIAADVPPQFARAMTPSEPRSFLASDGSILFGYVNDALYRIDPNRHEVRIVFHPVENGLRITDLGNGRMFFWMGNGRKAYIVDLTGAGRAKT